MELTEGKPEMPAEAPAEPQKEKKNAFVELTTAMKDKRQSLMSKIEEIKSLREKLQGMNKVGVKALTKKKEQLEFKVATEALTLDKERAFMKTIKGLEQEIKQAQAREEERKKILSRIKSLDGEIEALKNELDEMKLSLIKLREERKKKRAEYKKRLEGKEAAPRQKAPLKKEEEFFISLEDIAIMKKGNSN
ncbi:MAG: hypothetical protein N3G76_01255 [Candidatus Micrarchaeota archaeon]|nr:hypothetical protein [Candidatus Micrarchaeota archaeon]